MPANDDERDLEWVDVTPELAHEWLGRNTHNRNLRSRTVSAYASDMANGVWRQTGDGIRFSRDGVLLDGQHRLAAVVESGATIRTVVVRGLDVAVQNDMDSGIIRKFADVLALQTETNTANLAAIVRAVTVWEAGFRLQTNYQPTRSQLFATLSEYPWLRDVARDSSAASRGCGLPPSVIGLCWWLFSRIDSEDAGHFFARLGDGQSLVKGQPVYELRRTVIGTRDARGSRARTFLTAITIKAWNAYREGATVTVLGFRPGGAKPERFPDPK